MYNMVGAFWFWISPNSSGCQLAGNGRLGLEDLEYKTIAGRSNCGDGITRPVSPRPPARKPAPPCKDSEKPAAERGIGIPSAAASHPPIHYLTIVVVSFCAWISAWRLMCIWGWGYWASLLGVGNVFNITGWVWALGMASARFWGWNNDNLPTELVLPALMVAAGDWEGIVFRIQTPSADELLFAFDRIYGYPQFLLGRIFLASPVALWLGKAVYFMLMLPVVVIHLCLREPKLRWRLWISVALMGVFGVIFYYFCPAGGPVHAFAGFPRLPAITSPATRVKPHLIPNCVPSVHLAMAMLVLFFARHCNRACRTFTWIFLALTILVTLGLGEHYVIDLVLGVPFAVAIAGLTDRAGRARAYACFLLVLAWEVALAHGWALYLPTAAALLLSGLTIAVPFTPPLRLGQPQLAPIPEK
jgi:hypothetical protein